MKRLAVIYDEMIDLRVDSILTAIINTNVLQIKEYWTGEWEIEVGDKSVGYLWVDLIQKGD